MFVRMGRHVACPDERHAVRHCRGDGNIRKNPFFLEHHRHQESFFIVADYDGDDGGWKGMADKARGIAFRLEDNAGEASVVPDGLDRYLLGPGFEPGEDQMQAAAILLGILTRKIHAKTRFRVWELRAGQTVTVIGPVFQDQTGLVIRKLEGRPLIISPLLGQELDAQVSSQAGKSRTWMYILGIPGLIIFLCTVGGALISIVRAITAK